MIEDVSIAGRLAVSQKNKFVRLYMTIVRFARKKPLGAIGLAIVLVGLFAAIFGPLLAPYDPWATSRFERFLGPSVSHLLGTDNLGRDTFSRTLHGTRVSVYVGITTMLIAGTGGLILGVTSAYIGGKYDLIIQRFVDAIIGLPTLLLALALVAVLGQHINNIILAISIVQIPRMTRVIRSSAISIKENPYVEAAKATGATDLRIMLRHVAPNTFAPLIIVATTAIGAIIITEATLSFLGLGVRPGIITWGSLLGGNTRQYVVAAPWMAMGPGFALTFLVFGMNILGDALRDVLDPKLKTN